MLRTSLLYLLAAFTIGAAMLAGKAYPIYPQIWQLLPVHIEIAIFGWIIQFTMGTAYWILPRYLKTGARGDPVTAFWMMGLFNAGVIVNIVTYLHYVRNICIVWGRSFQSFAVVLIIVIDWKTAVSSNRCKRAVLFPGKDSLKIKLSLCQ